jgi:hydrogenase expression/formation protein HypC
MSGQAQGREPPDGARPRGTLPLVPSQAATAVTLEGLSVATEAVTEAACTVDDVGCITCGDVALPLTVVEVTQTDAVCRDESGRQELVAVDLVGAVGPGDLLLVHAGVALEQLDPTLQHHHD